MVKARVQLSLRAEDLENAGTPLIGTSDPYAVLTYEADGKLIGETEVINNTLNPHWAKVFFLDYEADTASPVSVRIFHKRSERDKDLLIGHASFDIGNIIMNTVNNIQEEHLDSQGRLYVHVGTSGKGEAKGLIELRLRGLDIKNVEPGILAMGRSDPFFEIAREEGNKDEREIWWNVVYRSEHVLDNHNPYWEHFTMDLEKLCYGNLDRQLLVTVYDWQRSGKHRAIGSFTTTAKGMLENKCLRGNGDRSRAYVLVDEGKRTGLLTVVEAKVTYS